MVEDRNGVDVARLQKDEVAHAVIHAVLPHHAERLLEGESDAFGKYIGYRRISDSLESCKRLMVYVSHGSKEVVGDAKIVRLGFLTTNDIVKRLGDRFFLSSVELDSYSRGRTKPLLVFELRDVRRYTHPVVLRKPITMAGQLISKGEFERIVQNGMHHS